MIPLKRKVEQMTLYKFFSEYISLVALTFLFFVMRSTDYHSFVLIALIELPIPLVVFLFRKIKRNTQ